MQTMKDHEELRNGMIHLLARCGCGKETNTPCDILADLMLSFYDSYELHVNRRDKRMRKPYHDKPDENPCDECKGCEPDEEEDESNERGYIVSRYMGHRRLLVFVEWRDKKPVLCNSPDLAMNFKYRGMAEHIAEKLVEIVGGKWEVIDLDELEENHEANERLLKAIFGENDEECNG